MKNKINQLLSIGGTLLLLCVASAYAQSTIALKASIPFSFKVHEAALPAGEYTITFYRNENWGGVVRLRSADRKIKIKAFAMDGTAKRLQDGAYLVFNCYGDQNFLSQIWTGSGQPGTVLPKSHDEQEVMSSALPGKTPMGLTPKLVTIAAR